MRTLLATSLTLLLSGCALFSPSDPVTVNVVGIDPLPGQDLEARMAVHLRLQNPNDRPIDYDGVALSLEINGQPLANGVSDQHGQVARYGEAMLTVPVSISAFSVLRQAVGFAAASPAAPVPYVLRGKLSGGLLGTVRFKDSGMLDSSAWNAAW
ncbi:MULTISPECIES: LEA type 2 family protein [unclassified Pseudomonas]|uniref:LEA type 2 family protein n=1 Tax=unclassified Pseudomonas TaxID=196821 RepID=UPI000BCD9319|nr:MULTISPECIES: LEA type 2 family protein [unclassified Pseudomonas]PVZ20274.1 LEA14-like dessication related protein [Pseudomonas sp. URIL14HWK12:I12]PVZ27340.1 LEA14-like dessication related protein [Pseudomonas sp. URIL14HWK12:I10]PVZ38229.1 LEA14-like dessication related protein [Pseudomonas sp. URIL14HWK12:I11]SNZ04174.1 LEA14-like dessication related protein [Pseudomonas sp. URIL14HWK12:I9]